MELQQLRYFLSVARQEHFTRASEELAVTQPSVSRAIARLEAELGAPLFERRGRRVRLNRLGRTFLRRVERSFGELEEGRREVQEQLDPERGWVVLGFLHTVGVQMLPGLLRAFRGVHPHVGFQLYQGSTPALLDQLNLGEIDLCISSLADGRRGLGWSDLMTEEVCLAVPPGHRLAGREDLRLREAVEEDFIGLKPGNSFRQLTDGFCRRAGFEPKVVFEGEEVATVRGLVGAGLGVALLPALAWQDAVSPLPLRLRVREPRCQRTIELAWVEDRYLSPAATLFRRFVIDHFARLKQS